MANIDSGKAVVFVRKIIVKEAALPDGRILRCEYIRRAPINDFFNEQLGYNTEAIFSIGASAESMWLDVADTPPELLEATLSLISRKLLKNDCIG